MQLLFELDRQKISRTDNQLVASSSRNYLTAKFDLVSADWQAPITAIFGDYACVLDERNECTIPWEVTQKAGWFDVSAFCGDLHTTNAVSVPVTASGYKPGQTPEPPTPDVYAQIAGIAQNAVNVAQSIRQDADDGKFIGQTGAKGDTGATPALTVSVLTGEPGTQARVEASGTLEEPHFDITVPRGDTGATGAQGIQGLPGKDAPQIDDTAVRTDTPWSSNKIVRALCPPFEAVGNPVTGSLMPGTEIEIKAAWTPKQDGDGDPSPENVRPIVGRESVQVRQYGKNLLSPDHTMVGQHGYVIGSATNNGAPVLLVKGYTYTLSFDKTMTQRTYVYADKITPYKTFGCNFVDKGSAINTFIFAHETGYYRIRLYNGSIWNDQPFTRWQLEVGNSATPYEPYKIPEARTLTLHRTVYGGEVDADGEGLETWGHTTISRVQSASVLETVVRGVSALPYEAPKAKTGSAMSSYLPEKVHFVDDAPGFYTNQRVVYIKIAKSMLATPDMAGLNTYLAAHPLDIVYKLATPAPFTATGGGTIAAIEGTNTIITDADSLTVTGLKDPRAAVRALEDRVLALETAQNVELLGQ